MPDTDPPDAVTPAAPPQPVAWSAAHRVAFRFVFAYLVLYNLPIPGFNRLAVAVGHQILGITRDIPVVQTGSGDTTVAYLALLVSTVVAAITAVIWSVADRRRREYGLLCRWLIAGVRVCLAMQLVAYGAAKIIQVQFPPPEAARLQEPFGQASPMGLLWTFMGFSHAYNVFAGLGEVLGPVLLCFRRTATLGALICVAVLSQVVVVNFTFDVPVKLFSLHLLLMAGLVVVPDLSRLANVLLFNRSTTARCDPPLFTDPTVNATMTTIFRGVAALYLVALFAGNARHATVPPPLGDLLGTYAVTDTLRAGIWQPVSAPGGDGWRQFTLTRYGVATVRFASGDSAVGVVKFNPAARTVTLTGITNLRWSVARRIDGTFSYERSSSSTLVLKGQVGGDSLQLRFALVTAPQYPLMTRGFHWIQEVPYNR